MVQDMSDKPGRRKKLYDLFLLEVSSAPLNAARRTD